jgi:hypothetical protein
MAGTDWLDAAPDASWLDNAPDAPRAPAGAAPVRSGSEWAQKVGEGVPGFNRLTAVAQAALDPIIPGRTAEWGPDFPTRYAEHLRANQHQSAQTQAEHPWLSAVAQVPLGAALAIGAGVPPSARGAGALGAAYAAGESRAKALDELVGEMMLGGAGGMLASHVPNAFGAAENAVRRGARWALPRITPTPAAQRLIAEGVPLTSGQMAGPESFVANLEAASADSPLGMGTEREAAKDVWRQVVLGKTSAPGVAPPTSGTTQQRQAAIQSGFGPVYSEIRSTPVDPSTAAALPEAALRMPGRVDARTRAQVAKEVENALTVLPDLSAVGAEPTPVALTRPARGGEAYRGGEFPAPPARGPLRAPDRREVLATAAGRAARRTDTGSGRLIEGTTRPNPNYDWSVASSDPAPPPTITADDLVAARTNIREQMAAARTSQDFDRLRLLGYAEDVITQGLESSLPPDQVARLRAADRQYAKLQTVLESAPGGKVEFTPDQLARSIEHASGRRAFKTGTAGDLQSLAQDAQSVFASPVKPTGMRGVVLAGLPTWPTRVAGRFINVPSVRQGLMPGGSFALPSVTPPVPAMSIASPGQTLEQYLAEALRRRMSADYLTPAAADQDPRNGAGQ